MPETYSTDQIVQTVSQYVIDSFADQYLKEAENGEESKFDVPPCEFTSRNIVTSKTNALSQLCAPHPAEGDVQPSSSVAPYFTICSAATEMNGTWSDAVGVLSPLEIMYGNTFIQSLRIADSFFRENSKAESKISLMEGDSLPVSTETPLFEKELKKETSALPELGYQIRNTTLYSPYHCLCSQFKHHCVRHKKKASCEHMLALRLKMAFQQRCLRKVALCTEKAAIAAAMEE